MLQTELVTAKASLANADRLQSSTSSPCRGFSATALSRAGRSGGPASSY